jgi:hypothetical protein
MARIWVRFDEYIILPRHATIGVRFDHQIREVG